MMLAAALALLASAQQGEDLVSLGLRYLARHQAPEGSWGLRRAACSCPAEPALPDPPVNAELLSRIELLIAALDDDDFQRREKAVRDLVAVGPPALAALRDSAAKGSPEARWRAKAALDRIGVAGTSEEVEATAMALVAFLGAGFSHLSRDLHDGISFGTVVKLGLQWLMARQRPDGSFEGATSAAQAWAAFALSEAYGMTASAPIKEPAQKAIEYIGGHPATDARTAFYQGLALKSAELADLSFPRSAGERAVAAVLARRADEPASIFVRAAAQILQIFTYKDMRRVDLTGLPGLDLSRMEMETLYVVGQAIFQAEGPHGGQWKAHRDRQREWIVPLQDQVHGKCDRGSWPAAATRERLKTAALATMSCEIYYR